MGAAPRGGRLPEVRWWPAGAREPARPPTPVHTQRWRPAGAHRPDLTSHCPSDASKFDHSRRCCGSAACSSTSANPPQGTRGPACTTTAPIKHFFPITHYDKTVFYDERGFHDCRPPSSPSSTASHTITSTRTLTQQPAQAQEGQGVSLDEFFDEVERLRRLTRDEALGPGSWAAAAATWVECGAMRRARCLHLTLPGDLLQEAEADAG
mmetsp:Transcript_118069/g.381060  ORF Transcript_118069/g.381060 Transcript_118069/m.381060 type:complete len:209 (-) Transcript_118069:221-847(-)